MFGASWWTARRPPQYFAAAELALVATPPVALSLTQPWATLVTLGWKGYETRSWYTKYRGPVAIHASKGFPEWAKGYAAEIEGLPKLPLGSILGVANLVTCERAEIVRSHVSEAEASHGDWAPGRWVWKLESPRELELPIPFKGVNIRDCHADGGHQRHWFTGRGRSSSERLPWCWRCGAPNSRWEPGP